MCEENQEEKIKKLLKNLQEESDRQKVLQSIIFQQMLISIQFAAKKTIEEELYAQLISSKQIKMNELKALRKYKKEIQNVINEMNEKKEENIRNKTIIQSASLLQKQLQITSDALLNDIREYNEFNGRNKNEEEKIRNVLLKQKEIKERIRKMTEDLKDKVEIKSKLMNVQNILAQKKNQHEQAKKSFETKNTRNAELQEKLNDLRKQFEELKAKKEGKQNNSTKKLVSYFQSNSV
ncbi:hypothetical protein PVAND_001015 [Polypedilum vanderplanki]|uniref:Uncharacterized protein n=1 Tax=Polypedilum vanderplanki TaxID=319348 RepID=A0A9J6BM91_POLVA|nr:hypothetical protein PVAND_001015 [Polypedilum vanderplanki]